MSGRPVPSFANFRSSSRAASDRMRRNQRDGGVAERALRSAVWRRGLRFRKHVRGMAGSPDLVFSRQRVCVFCDGDYWHGRRWAHLSKQLARRANGQYWLAKIAANRARDRRSTRQLRASGWTVIRLWETDVLADPETAARHVERYVRYPTI